MFRPLIIVVRQSMRWDGPEELARQNLYGKPVVRLIINPRVQAFWKRYFRLPFHEFRRRVRDIARNNLQAVAGSRLFLSVAAFNQALRAGQIPPGSLVVPIDDDDWLAPDLGSLLQPPAGSGLLWQSSRVACNRPVRDIDKGRPLCRTNNSAITLGYLAGLPNHDRSMVLAYHWEAGKRLAGKLGYLPIPGSVIVRHPASITQLSMLARRYLNRPRAFRQYLPTIRHRLPIPEGLEWCRPYYTRLLALYREAV